MESKGDLGAVASGTVENGALTLSAKFDGQGARNYAISVTANGVESVSPNRSVTIYDPQVTATPAITTTGMGDRFLRVFSTSTNVPAGTKANVEVLAPAMTTSALSTQRPQTTKVESTSGAFTRTSRSRRPAEPTAYVSSWIQSSQESPLTRLRKLRSRFPDPPSDSLRRLR